MKINKKFLSQGLTNDFGLSKEAAGLALGGIFDTITYNLELGNEVEIHGFGKFSAVEKKARKARNPATGETIEVPARRSVRFKPSSTLKDAVNTSGAKGII